MKLASDSSSTVDPYSSAGHRIRLVACATAAARIEAAEELLRSAHALLVQHLPAQCPAVPAAFSAETAAKIARHKLDIVLRRLP